MEGELGEAMRDIPNIFAGNKLKRWFNLIHIDRAAIVKKQIAGVFLYLKYRMKNFAKYHVNKS